MALVLFVFSLSLLKIIINADLNNLLIKHYNFDIQKNCESLKDLERLLELLAFEISEEFRKIQKKQPQVQGNILFKGLALDN